MPTMLPSRPSAIVSPITCPNRRRAAGAERRADRQVALAHHRARQQQVRHIGARDQQQQAGRGQQHPQPARRVLGDHFV